jgi:hypothetical protein
VIKDAESLQGLANSLEAFEQMRVNELNIREIVVSMINNNKINFD